MTKQEQNEAESETKTPKKWYLKIEKNYYNEPIIKLIKSRNKGYQKLVIYQELLSLGTGSNGFLIINDKIPMTEKDIANMINEPLAAVKETLGLLEKIGVLEVLENNIYFLNQVPVMQGSISDTQTNQRQIRHKEKQIQEEIESKKEHIQDEIQIL